MHARRLARRRDVVRVRVRARQGRDGNRRGPQPAGDDERAEDARERTVAERDAQLQFNLKNVFDKEYREGNMGGWGDPRNFLVSLGMKF